MLINDLNARISAYRTPIEEALQAVVSSGWLVLGPQVKRFEGAFAHYIGTQHCVSVANGTDAIELALRALGIEAGDRVATVANAGMYTTTALIAIGAEPFYMDVDESTANAPLADVARAIQAGCKAVVVTHLYGLAAPDIAEIATLCQQHGVQLLEDCAQAHGARVSGQTVGSFGDAASFSFYPTKNLGALGDGGAVVTHSDVVAEKVLRLRQYGWGSKYSVEDLGARNSRLDELQAALLLAFLPSLDACNQRRRDIARQYSEGISHTAVQTPEVHGEASVGHLYVVRSPKRDALRAHLASLSIASDVHYPIPDYRQPAFGNRFADVCLPNTEKLAREILTLPCYPEMTDEQVQEVIAGVNSWQS
jgi:dTDP-3-amino-2,3,6-trideoxy-4-keto-D-glucose/dTDP-3-amino-3,4,6-trideoxy-alpha-D-glucose/dTDP-2,6-dideoxy-D-kanosamine transaminase